MPIRYCLIADLHVHPWTEHSTLDKDGVPSRLRDCLRVLEVALSRDSIEEHGYDAVVLAGDIFHKRGSIATQAFNLVTELLAKAKHDNLIEVFAAVGNHDQADKAGTIHPLQAWQSAGLLELIDDNKRHGTHLHGISYCDSREDFEQRLDALEKPKGAVLICHHGFSDARVGGSLEFIVKEDISPEAFKGRDFRFVFSGHYHRRQPIGSGIVDNAMYIGSPLEHVRGDHDPEGKGFLVYDTETNDTLLVPIKAPQFVQLTQNRIHKEKWKHVKGNFVDVIYEELPCDPNTYRDRLIEAGARGVKMLPQPKKREAVKRMDINLGMDARTLLSTYMKNTKQQLEGLDEAEVLRTGLSLLSEIQK